MAGGDRRRCAGSTRDPGRAAGRADGVAGTSVRRRAAGADHRFHARDCDAGSPEGVREPPWPNRACPREPRSLEPDVQVVRFQGPPGLTVEVLAPAPMLRARRRRRGNHHRRPQARRGISPARSWNRRAAPGRALSRHRGRRPSASARGNRPRQVPDPRRLQSRRPGRRRRSRPSGDQGDLPRRSRPGDPVQDGRRTRSRSSRSIRASPRCAWPRPWAGRWRSSASEADGPPNEEIQGGSPATSGSTGWRASAPGRARSCARAGRGARCRAGRSAFRRHRRPGRLLPRDEYLCDGGDRATPAAPNCQRPHHRSGPARRDRPFRHRGRRGAPRLESCRPTSSASTPPGSPRSA